MKQICIGIHAYEQPGQLLETLASVRSNTDSTAQIVLLPDGPDAALGQALQSLKGIPQFGSETPRGAPACFNRLAAKSDAGIVILLESGVRVAPYWLDRLVAALDADPSNGLAGPSTNRAWNEQGAFPDIKGEAGPIALAAQTALDRFGGQYFPLKPLYSLADFCYAVRREVIQQIGGADEKYRLGPCWEMDYNIRAARAGWHGVWACASFVWRAPPSERRRREEHRLFEVNKRLYQDKFCGGRLRGIKVDYRDHCRGDDCINFAPSSMKSSQAASAPLDLPVIPEPLVSCIMPTYNRRQFIPLALRFFMNQDYPNKELVIIDDGQDRIGDLAADLPGVRYIPLSSRLSIGAKRNLACEAARGEIIAHWDDDDWYAPNRLRYQVAPILAGKADLTGLANSFVLDVRAGQFWTTEPALHRKMFAGDVHGGTLVFRKELLKLGLRYPDVNLAEDAWIIRHALKRGMRLLRLENPGVFVYVRHGSNSWGEFDPGHFLNPSGWFRIAPPSTFPSNALEGTE